VPGGALAAGQGDAVGGDRRLAGLVLDADRVLAEGGLFPVLDGDFRLTPAGADAARLALAGVYRPPLGRLGASLDRAVLHRVADATIRALLRTVADAVTSPAVDRAAWTQTLGGLPPWPATEPGSS
jgi:hypothetical protein